MAIKTGTRVSCSYAMGDRRVTGTIARATKASHPLLGWHIVKFDDGGKMCVHGSQITVTDNRAGYGRV
jgi:hypothetical protein